MRYTLLAALTFGPGSVLGLSVIQAARRAAALEPAGEGLFRALSPVQFKAGEVVELHGDLPRVVESQVVAFERAAPVEVAADAAPVRAPAVKRGKKG